MAELRSDSFNSFQGGGQRSPLLLASSCSERDPPAQGSPRLRKGTSHPCISPSLHISICFGVRNTQHLDLRPHGVVMVAAGEAKDFVERQKRAGGGTGMWWIG